ncbi:RNA polymerase II [Chytridium lagenaria]|nr:RNA polymerase II [Chytridium lagenaria]
MSSTRKTRRGIAEDEDAAEMRLGDEFQDVQCLLISEVRVLLEVAKERNRSEGRESTSDVMQKTMDYCERFSRFNNKQTIKEMRHLKMAQLANLCCETVDEAKALIPSLAKRFDSLNDKELQDLLDQMSNIRKFQQAA